MHSRKNEGILYKKKIVCVTGAAGRIGRRLVEKLSTENFQVRVLKHRTPVDDSDLQIYQGDIGDKESVEDFLTDADYLFHCAAEINNPAEMWDINVNGTKNLVEAAKRKQVKYFCFLSSAGVVGKTDKKQVHEEIACAPQNLYEKTKLEAERIVLSGIKGCRVVALRPANVVDENNHGVMQALNSNTLSGKLKLFLRGGEGAHIVHTDDVANAALYFMDKQFDEPKCFFLAYDEDPLNTFAGVRLLYDSLEKKQSIDKTPKAVCLPIVIPYFLRKILRGNSNMGDIRYSSKRILSHGFNYKIGLRETIRKYWATNRKQP